MILQSSWKVRFSKFWTVLILLLLASPHHSWNLTPRTALCSTSNTLDSFKTLQFSCTPHTYTEMSILPPPPPCIIYLDFMVFKWEGSCAGRILFSGTPMTILTDLKLMLGVSKSGFRCPPVLLLVEKLNLLPTFSKILRQPNAHPLPGWNSMMNSYKCSSV